MGEINFGEVAMWLALAIIFSSFAHCDYKQTEAKYQYKTAIEANK